MMNDSTSLQSSMLLWLPNTSELEPEETRDLIQKVTLANGAILDFCDGEVPFDDTLEIIEFYGADVDEYRSSIAETLLRYGA